MAKQNNEIADNIVKWGLIAGAGLLAVKFALGSITNSADTATVEGLATLGNDQNPFSPSYTISMNQIAKEGMTPQAYYQSLHDTYMQALNAGLMDNGSQFELGKGFDVAIYAEQINANIGEFFLFNNVDNIKAVFNEVPDQETVGEIAGYFSYILNADLISTLRDGSLSFSWLRGGIGDTNVAEIINHVMSLPENTNPTY